MDGPIRETNAPLPGRQVAQETLSLRPRPKTSLCVDVTNWAGIDEFRLPSVSKLASAREGYERIIGARHHAAKWQRTARHRSKTANVICRVMLGINIGRRDE